MKGVHNLFSAFKTNWYVLLALIPSVNLTLSGQADVLFDGQRRILTTRNCGTLNDNKNIQGYR